MNQKFHISLTQRNNVLFPREIAASVCGLSSSSREGIVVLQFRHLEARVPETLCQLGITRLGGRLGFTAITVKQDEHTFVMFAVTRCQS